MKKYLIIILIAVFICSTFISSRSISSIYGAIEPPESVVKVIAIKDKDSLVVIPHDGRFSIKVTAGVWKLYLVASSPYKDMHVDHVNVTEGMSTDVGVIRVVEK